MTRTNQHSAVDSALGYYYQGMFALVVLLDAEDGTQVSIETEDDVYLEGRKKTLHQLKHSLAASTSLTVQSEALWKTLRIWSNHKLDSDTVFVLVTCSSIAQGSSLSVLMNDGTDRTALQDELETEAKRVVETRKQQQSQKKSLSYEVKASGCEAYLKLTKSNRKKLLSRIRIAPGSFSAKDVTKEVCRRLATCVRPEFRNVIAERLIEWWDRRVVLSLLKERPRQIRKLELQQKIQELIRDQSDGSLPDTFSRETPDSLDSELGGNMEKQIRFVNGGSSRIRRAALSRWRARNQRDYWLRQDISIAAALADYDEQLIEHWQDRFEPMCDDCNGLQPDEICNKGKGLLDWSHHDAPSEVPPLRSGSQPAFFVQGTYQQMADTLQVGWHANFKELLKEVNQEESVVP